MWFFSTLPPAPLIGHELRPHLLCQPMMTESGLASYPSAQDGLFASATFPDLGEDRPSVFFRLPKKKRWKGGGKTNFSFLFGSSGKAEGQGTVGEGGASLCLTYYAKNKTNKKQLALSAVEGRPSPRLMVFPRSWEAKALAASQGEH